MKRCIFPRTRGGSVRGKEKEKWNLRMLTKKKMTVLV